MRSGEPPLAQSSAWLTDAAWTLVGTMLLFCGACSSESEPKPPAPGDRQPTDTSTATTPGGVPVATAEGKQLYLQHCATCHGEQGDGKGKAAAYLFPKPRDFRAGNFRLVSTTNNVPTADDLDAVLVRGMPGSAMPPWAHLSKDQRRALIAEVFRLRREGARDLYVNKILKGEEELSDDEIAQPEYQKDIQAYVDRQTTPGESLAVPEIGPPDDAAIARGKEVYLKQSCDSCHGKEGKGDGAKEMFDNEGYATRPRDYTRGIFKAGDDPASLYRRIAYGMPGTPMPSSSQLTPEQSIDLVHFIRSLSTEEDRQAAILRREKIVVGRIDAVPSAPEAEPWSRVAPVRLRMVPLWWRDDSDPDLQVQALHDGEKIALRLSWRDETADTHAARTESFRDAVAVELYRGAAEPFLGMGSAEVAVDMWLWDADRQGAPTASAVYPNTVVDVFPFSEAAVAGPELNRPGATAADQPDVSLPARAVGNPIVPGKDGAGASMLTAGGPGTITFRIPQNPTVMAKGQWTDGRWNVVMTRRLAVDSPGEGVALKAGETVSAAFAIWDGSLQDRDGKKLITIWQDLILSD